jgi:hypothetical protein
MHRTGPTTAAQDFLCSATTGRSGIGTIEISLSAETSVYCPPDSGISVGNACFTASTALRSLLPVHTLEGAPNVSIHRDYTDLTIGAGMPAVRFYHECCYNRSAQPPPHFALEWDGEFPTATHPEHKHGTLRLIGHMSRTDAAGNDQWGIKATVTVERVYFSPSLFPHDWEACNLPEGGHTSTKALFVVMPKNILPYIKTGQQPASNHKLAFVQLASVYGNASRM